jgi:hypothetical protein
MMKMWVSRDTEVAMFQRTTTTVRKSVCLGVVPLEERATPAAPVLFMPPVQPPAIVVVMPPTVAPGHPAMAGDSAVRSDLFGSGDADQPQVDELEEMLAREQDARKDATATEAPATPHKEMDAGDADAAGAVIIEDASYLPPAA